MFIYQSEIEYTTILIQKCGMMLEYAVEIVDTPHPTCPSITSPEFHRQPELFSTILPIQLLISRPQL